MRKIYILVVIISTSLLVTGFIKFNKPAYTNIPTNAFGTGNVINATRFASWINNVTPSINVFVKPADGPNFVGDNNVTPSSFDRQDFFRWSQQMFYWILSPVPSNGSYGSCGGLVLNSPAFYDVQGSNFVRHTCDNLAKTNMTFDIKSTQNGKNDLPIFFEQNTDRIFDIDKTPKSIRGYQIVKDGKGKIVEVGNIKVKGNIPTFYDLKGEVIEIVELIYSKDLDYKTTVQQFEINKIFYNVSLISPFAPIIILPSVAQASNNGSSNVLMARNGSLVYYNIMVNDVYAIFSKMVNNNTLPSNSSFPTTSAELNVISNYANSIGMPLIKTEGRVLAMELKTSWIDATNLTNSNNYIKTSATVPNYIQTSPGIWTKSGTRKTTLALVGMHVVGSVLGHPEMIWSTFEHKNNTPNNGYPFTNNNNGITSVSTDDSAIDFNFAQPRTNTYTPNFNVSHITGFNNLSGANGFTISNSDTKRNQPFGWGGVIASGGSPNLINPIDVMTVENSNAQLVAINTDGNSRLINGDIRKNYFQVGSTWMSLFETNQQAGTIRLSNSTMETYTQATNARINIPGGAGLNCFSCHDTGGSESPAPKEVFLSHVFFNTIAK